MSFSGAFDAEEQRLVVSVGVRPIKAPRDHCGLCRRSGSPRFDGGGRRR